MSPERQRAAKVMHCTGRAGRAGPRSRRGFTLIEVLVSVALGGALAGGLFAFFADLSRTRDRIAQSARESAEVAVALDRMESDLWCAIAGGAGLGAGVEGDARRVSVLTRAVSVGVAGVADLQKCEYEFEGGRILASRAVVSRGAESSAASESLVEGLDLVRIRYFDGQEWVDTFNSMKAGALPVAVEVAMWFVSRGPAYPGAAGPGRSAAMDAPPGEWTPEDQGGPEDFDAGERLRKPDRMRVLIVPDGPVSAWRESR